MMGIQLVLCQRHFGKWTVSRLAPVGENYVSVSFGPAASATEHGLELRKFVQHIARVCCRTLRLARSYSKSDKLNVTQNVTRVGSTNNSPAQPTMG